MNNNSISFNCDNCGREIFGCNFVNGMKFCVKCYQEIFGNQQNKESSELLVNSLAEKDKQIAELQKQLEEKEKRCEICGSKMILGELGYYCSNTELHNIYPAPNEAKPDYEEITLLKQDYDAMVEREELLRQQLAEKEKENERLKEEICKYEITLMDKNSQLKQQLHDLPKKIVEEIMKELNNIVEVGDYFDIETDEETNLLKQSDIENILDAILEKFGDKDESNND